MPLPEALHVMIGWDSRESAASEVAAHSIRKRTKSPLDIKYLKHRDLRLSGHFRRHWQMDASTGDYRDSVDGKPFSTEFSHTRFLVPSLMEYNGWALFMDADMLFLTDIEKLFAMRDNKYAVMCVKHKQEIACDKLKMDGRVQLAYPRKNWSSFVLWNCGHPANKQLTQEKVSFATGAYLHAFEWLPEELIGSIPFTYNFISGVSPKLPPECGGRPYVVHYTEGGPWFENCRSVPYSQLWLDEYEDWQNTRQDYLISEVPTLAYERPEVQWK